MRGRLWRLVVKEMVQESFWGIQKYVQVLDHLEIVNGPKSNPTSNSWRTAGMVAGQASRSSVDIECSSTLRNGKVLNTRLTSLAATRLIRTQPSFIDGYPHPRVGCG